MFNLLLIIVGAVLFTVAMICIGGLKVVNPNEALVLTLFGKYYGTIKSAGFYFVNPFATAFNPGVEKVVTKNADGNVYVKTVGSKKVSTKVCTLNNEKQKVNDVLGNPIIIGAVVIWKVTNPTQAVFAVENYRDYLSIQCDSTIRNIARLYPYDTMEEDSDEKTLRASSKEIADSMRDELQEKVEVAGLEILEVRITHLSYAEEIAAAMLQRQQAVAVIAARQKIVEGAVSMVQMAIEQLSEEEIVVLDEERKAAMVSNLLVVLCGNKEAQPIVNSGSIY
jgi:regulator of protease activity HflC (stomatin/prohibitin superfamily)